MRKLTAAVMIFDIVIGIFLFCEYRDGRQPFFEQQPFFERHPFFERVKAGSGSLWDGMQKAMFPDPEGAGNRKKQEMQKKIALTFDDGPHPYYTEQLLDGLKERGVAATFFVTGEHAKLHPDVIKRMKAEGHLIGNHTYSHMQLNQKNREKFKAELIATNQVIKEITGEETEFVRPPYGSWDKSFEKELNMFPVFWTVDPLDWSSRNVSSIVRKIMSKAGENDIILMHDYYETSVTAALKAVDALLAEGFVFVTVEEILFD